MEEQGQGALCPPRAGHLQSASFHPSPNRLEYSRPKVSTFLGWALGSPVFQPSLPS